MLAIVVSLPLMLLVLAIGVALPWLALRLELMYRNQQRAKAILEAQSHLIADQQATIQAYRELVAGDAQYAVSPH